MDLLAMLLIVLWVRSYSGRAITKLIVTSTYRYYLRSIYGSLVFHRQERLSISSGRLRLYQIEEVFPFVTNSGLKIGRDSRGEISTVSVSFWLPILIVSTFVAFPWISKRFSLRTLLIAATLVAVVLGLVVWLSHR
jgi:hypothetical protein